MRIPRRDYEENSREILYAGLCGMHKKEVTMFVTSYSVVLW